MKKKKASDESTELREPKPVLNNIKLENIPKNIILFRIICFTRHN
jgi:hypothetical protein